MIDDLVAALERNSCVVHRAHPGRVAAVVTERVTAHARGGEVAWADHPCLTRHGVAASLDAAGARVLLAADPRWRERLADAAVGVTGADLGVAEQGVVVVPSGPGAPRSVSLVPPVHVCLLAGDRVVATFAEAIERLARCEARGGVTLVGGPSRTGDLEMRSTLGIHGPRQVEVVIVDGPGAA